MIRATAAEVVPVIGSEDSLNCKTPRASELARAQSEEVSGQDPSSQLRAAARR
jgi:hypothetical protein